MMVSTCTTERPTDRRVGGTGDRSDARAGQRNGWSTHDRLGETGTQAIPRSPVINLAILPDYALVSAGVAAMLADAPIDVVQTETSLTDGAGIDIVLYDPCGHERMPTTVSELSRVGQNTKVVIYSWDIQPEVAQRAVRQGAAGCLAKSLPGPELVVALERIMRGEIVVITGDDASAGVVDDSSAPTDGLSARETEVLALIAGGLSNHEIAARLYVSINSVKAYIRSAYRKIGVERRTQAVLWGIRHGLSWDADIGGDDSLSA
jgi:NarL family two-component system response regulator LiaR